MARDPVTKDIDPSIRAARKKEKERHRFVMEWDEWIKLTDAEQEAVRQRYERPGSEALPGSLSVEEQRCLLHSLTRPDRPDSSQVNNTQGE
jgi:hypothetical protein